jgi:acyl-CoA dehydrogenase
MVDFALTEEELNWQKKSRDFAAENVRPVCCAMDQGTDRDHGAEVARKLSEEGYLCLSVPREYGGAGLKPVSLAVIVEELAVTDPGVAFTVSMNLFPPVQVFGNEKQKEKVLPQLCAHKEPKQIGFALTEPDAGSDVAAISTRAELQGDHFILRGRKCFISNGGVAHYYTVFANADKSKGAKGISAFIVPGDTAGLAAGKVEDKMGFRSSPTAELILEDVKIPKENLLLEIGQGFPIAMGFLDSARTLSCGAVSVGLARGALETVLSFYKKTPEKGKKVINQQIISHALADMAAGIEASRLLVWKAAWMSEKGLPVTKDSAMAKFYASDMAMKVATDALQMIGLNGYSQEFPLEKLLRDAKVLQIYEGTNQIQRVVVSRGLFVN